MIGSGTIITGDIQSKDIRVDGTLKAHKHRREGCVGGQWNYRG